MSETKHQPPALFQGHRPVTGYRNRFVGHVEDDVARSLSENEDGRQLLLSENDEVGYGHEVAEAAFRATLVAEAEEDEEDLVFALLERMRDAAIACLRCIEAVLGIYRTRYRIGP